MNRVHTALNYVACHNLPVLASIFALIEQPFRFRRTATLLATELPTPIFSR